MGNYRDGNGEMSSKPQTTRISEVPPSLRGDKAALREWAKARRATLDIPTLSAVLTERLKTLPEMQKVYDRAIYLAMADEINIEGVIDSDANAFWYAPRCSPGRELRFYPYIPGVTPLTSGPFGIREPAAADPRGYLMWEEIDLIIVPALLLTPAGARLGYGGGYYDRFLPRLRPDCVTVGVLPAALVVSELPQDSWDIPLQIVITENDIFSA